MEKTTEEHMEQLSHTMQKEAQREVWNSAALSPREAINSSVNKTNYPLTFLADNKVVCIFGFGEASPLSMVAYPWMLGSYLLPKHYREFARVSKNCFQYIKDNYTSSKGYVDEDFTSSVRWLKWLGYTIHPAEPFGVYNHPFHLFTWEK